MTITDLFFLKVAFTRASEADDVDQQGSLSRKIGVFYHEEATRERATASDDDIHSLLGQAEHYLKISQACFIETSDPAQLYWSRGLHGAVKFDGGHFGEGIVMLTDAIPVLDRQGAEAAELDLIIHLMLRQRPEAWVYLKRALQLTNKYSLNARRRWDVVAAAIGTDLYEGLQERRRRARAA